MISHERAIELSRQAERLYREIVRWHGTPRAGRTAIAYARTIDRLLEYKTQRLAREDTTTTTDPTDPPPPEGGAGGGETP